MHRINKRIGKNNKSFYKVISITKTHIITATEIFKITVPAHKPVKRSTLSHIMKQAKITLEEFLKSL